MLSRYNVSSPLLPAWVVPTSSGTSLHHMMSRLFDDLETAFHHPLQGRVPLRGAGGRPRVQLRDTDDAVVLIIDLPGHRLEDVSLEIEDRTLTLQTKPRQRDIPEGFNSLRRERSQTPLRLSFVLPYAVDTANATANLRQGRLEILLPKAPEAEPRSIPVSAA